MKKIKPGKKITALSFSKNNKNINNKDNNRDNNTAETTTQQRQQHNRDNNNNNRDNSSIVNNNSYNNKVFSNPRSLFSKGTNVLTKRSRFRLLVIVWFKKGRSSLYQISKKMKTYLTNLT